MFALWHQTENNDSVVRFYASKLGHEKRKEGFVSVVSGLPLIEKINTWVISGIG